MTPDESFRGNQHATKRWRVTVVPLLASIGLHGLLALLTLTAHVPLSPPSNAPPDSPESLTIRLVTSTTPEPEATGTRADTPAVSPDSSPQPEASGPLPPDTGRRDVTEPVDTIVLQPPRTPTTGPTASGEAEAVTGPDTLAIRESIQGLARAERERRTLEDCTETQRRSELFGCEQNNTVSEEITNGTLLPQDFLADPEPIRVANDQDLPFTERDPADRVLDNLRTGDRTYDMIKRVMGRR